VAVVVIELSFIGSGLGYRPALQRDIFTHQSQIPLIEIIADDYLDLTPEQYDELAFLRAHFVVLPHAVGLSLGSADGIDCDYVEKLAQVIRLLNPPWWSEHISFTKVSGIDIGHLTSLPNTQESVTTLARNYERVKKYISTPCLLENTACLLRPTGTLKEHEFITAVLDATRCDFLFDVTNFYINAVNNGKDPHAELHLLPLHKTKQWHITGGRISGDFLIDSHDQATPDPVWKLAEAAAKIQPPQAVILERDYNFPPFNELLSELNRASSLAFLHVTA
jgi:uncharacterized protein